MSNTEPFDEKGYWWLPSDPDDQIAGILSFDHSNGIRLELFGTFHPFANRIVPDLPIVHGVTIGRKATLYNSVYSGRGFGSPGFEHSTLRATHILFGHLFENPDEIRFSSFSVKYQFLEEWAGLKVFSTERDSDPRSEIRRVIYARPKSREIRVKGIKIELDSEFTPGGDAIREVRLAHSNLVRMTFGQPISLDEFLSGPNFLLENLFTLAIGRPTPAVGIVARSEALFESDSNGENFPLSVEILYPNPVIPQLPRRVYHRDMLFSLKDIDTDFELVLNKWFEKEQMLRPVYNLYFSMMNMSPTYLETMFLTMTRALETYHRRVFGGHYVENGDYEAIQERLVKAIPERVRGGFREALTQKIHYFNEFSLRKRLEEILQAYRPVCGSFIRDEGKFIEETIYTRNFLTHFEPQIEAKSLSGTDLYWLAQGLKCLLEVCLLVELGFATDKVCEIVKRTERFRFPQQPR